MMKKVLIQGNVQRVFFRKFVEENAIELGLRGYVKNLENGDVEAVFDGDDGNVMEIIERCKKGPSGSKVEKVFVEDFSGEEFGGFEIRY